MATNSFYTDSNETIIVNGVKMTMAEYKKKIKDAKKAKESASKKSTRKPKKRETEITILPSEIKVMMRGLRLMKSLSAYYDHGYRQWGTIARDIINLKEIRTPFVSYRQKAREIESLISEIGDISKRNRKEVFAYVQKLAWQLDDAKTYIDRIGKGVSSSNVMQQFADHECINGEGRRLGLRTLVSRTYSTIKEMEKVIQRLQTIADNGVDIMNINEHLSVRSVKVSVNC